MLFILDLSLLLTAGVPAHKRMRSNGLAILFTQDKVTDIFRYEHFGLVNRGQRYLQYYCDREGSSGRCQSHRL
jgi:hypothetical protein